MAAEKVALFTGCSEGSLAWGLAKELKARGGWRIIGATLADATVIPGMEGCHIVHMDVTSSSSVDAAVAKVAQLTGGQLDLVVNCAGIGGGFAPLLDADIEKVRLTHDINVLGTLRVIQATSKLLLKDGPVPFGSKRIVNFSSTAGFVSIPYFAPYSMSKYAICAMSDALRVELGHLGIQVLVIAPGTIQSTFTLTQQKCTSDLPTDSFYYGKAWSKVLTYSSASSNTTSDAAMPQDVFAKQVITIITSAKPPNYSAMGKNANKLWYLSYLPSWFKDREMSKRANLAPNDFNHVSVKMVA